MTVATGTREWATHNVNIDIGCPGGCLYCYACAMAIQYGRATPTSWPRPHPNRSKIPIRKVPGRIMFPSTHDIQPGNLDRCTAALWEMLEAGNEVLVVSKPTLTCIERLAKASEAELLKLMYINCRMFGEYGPDETGCEALGIDMDAVEKQARQEFETEWAKGQKDHDTPREVAGGKTKKT